MSLSGTTVLVTGAGGGSGETTARAFLHAGYPVIAGDLQVPVWETEYESLLTRVKMDISQEDQVNDVVRCAVESGHPIQILINNAGVAIGVPIEQMSTEIWNKNLSVNATGTFFCTRAVVSILLEKGLPGSIINIASIAGKNGFANTAAYCASKAGVIGMTRGLAAELGPRDITVNAICPGSVDTPMIQRVINGISADTGEDKRTVRRRMESSIPMNRFQKPEDIAALALFLASDGARNISGEAINLDGGVVRD